jgi:hypothetical protein
MRERWRLGTSSSTTSWIHCVKVANTCGRFSASFMVGIITLTVGAAARWGRTMMYRSAVGGRNGAR